LAFWQADFLQSARRERPRLRSRLLVGRVAWVHLRGDAAPLLTVAEFALVRRMEQYHGLPRGGLLARGA